MKDYTFPFLILLLTSYFFGIWVFLPLAAIVSLLFYFEKKSISFFLIFLLALPSILFMPAGFLGILALIFLAEKDNFYRVAYFLGSLFLVFILFPIINLLLYTTPKAFLDPALLHAIGISFLAATVATLIALLFSLPLGYVLARRNFWAKGLVESVIDIPIVIPHTVAGILMLLVFGSTGLWGKPLEEWGIRFYYALPGIIVAMLFVSAPFLINQVREGIAKIDERYEYTAMSLGASRWRVFFEIILPQIKGNIMSGAVNTWARAVSEFGAVIMIAFYPMIAPTYIYYLYTNYGLHAALPATAFLLLLTLAIFLGIRFAGRRMHNA